MNIQTLVPDIYNLFNSNREVDEANLSTFTKGLASLLRQKFQRNISDRKAYPPRLTASNWGKPCSRQLWYMINTPEDAAPLSPKAKLKFLLGDILEYVALFLAAEAGHKVLGVGDKGELEGLPLRRDCVIDGVLTDVKSASSRSFIKFDKGELHTDDPFGYRTQLQTYLEAYKDDPLVEDKKNGAFFVINKELATLCLDVHPKENINFAEQVAAKREMIAQPEPPDRSFVDHPDGKSGNRKLKAPCTYCDFKEKCWPNLRVFFYSNGPTFLTHVERTPKVQEMNDRTTEED